MLLSKLETQTKQRLFTAFIFLFLVTLHIPLLMGIRFAPKTNYNAVAKSGSHVVMSIQGSTAAEKQKKKTEPLPPKSIQADRSAKVIEKALPPEEKIPPLEETPSDEAHESEKSEYAAAEDTKASNGEIGALESAYAEGIEDVRMKIAEQIQKHKLYPLAARKRALEGDVELSVTVLAAGTVQELRVLKDDVSALLRDAAILSVKNALPFKVHIASPLPMKITLRYELSG